MKNLIINTRPDEQPITIDDAATAEHDGRYSDGSHSIFWPFHVIHVLSAPKPMYGKREGTLAKNHFSA